MPKKTKILAVGDIHGDAGLAKRLAEKAIKENVDLVILAGDITWLDQPVKNIIAPFAKANKQVLLIPGNHDTVSTMNMFAEVYPGTKNIHGYSVTRGELGIFGAGYHHLTGPFWVEDEEIFQALKKSHEHVKNAKKKIMVTHAHHEGGKAEFSGIPGSHAVRKAIEQFKPDFTISAHIHEAGGIIEKIGKTTILNVSRKPMIFEV